MAARPKLVVRCVALSCVAVFVAGAEALAAQTATPAKLLQKEKQARDKAAAELREVARFATSIRAWNEARATYSIALVVAPEYFKAKADLEELKEKKQTGTATPEQRAQLAEKKTKALAKCAELLAPVAAAWAEADRSDDLARVVSLMRAHEMPADAVIAKLDLVWFEPFFDFRRRKDVERLQAGWDLIEGVWCDPAEVVRLDATHTGWHDPWRVGDDVHEVRTTMPLRTARRILAMVSSFRGFLFGYLAGEMDLRTPRSKLPIILTATRDEMEQQVREIARGREAPAQAAAFYLAGSGVGNPCFVSFEMRSATGATLKVDLAGMRHVLLHEVTHQLLFEYSKHAADPRRMPENDPWVVEGIAEFLPNHALVDGVWVLKHPRHVAAGKGAFVEAPFAWCREQSAKLAPLAEFVEISETEMHDVRNYHYACGLVAFLLEANDGVHRAAICRLAEQVHQVRERTDSFEQAFAGVDLAALDKEFRAFCAAIKLDDK